MPTVVISNRTQWDAFIRTGEDPRFVKIYCDNPRFYSFLETQGLSYVKLDEYSLTDSWRKVNAWGCARTNDWIRQARPLWGDGPDLVSAAHLFWSHLMIQAWKNRAYALNILAARPKKLWIFHAEVNRDFPYFLGNAYLNTFLSEGARAAGIPAERLSVYEKENTEYVLPIHHPFHKKVTGSLKRSLQGLLTAKPKAGTRADVVIFGSLRHLASAALALKKKGQRIAFYDFEFHFEQASFAFKHGFEYWIPASFPNTGSGTQGAAFEKKFTEAFESAAAAGIFHWENYDFAPFLRRRVLTTMGAAFSRWAEEAKVYSRLLEYSGADKYLVDEDYAMKGAFFAAYLTARGCKLYCVSHANLAADFEVPIASRQFGLSTMFVQSPFEADRYAARGWKVSNFEVTGTPRYDRLMRMLKKRRLVSKKRKRIFYCATGLWLHSPDQHGYLGSHLVSYGDVQIPALELLLKTLEGRPVEFVAKPHSYEATGMWRQFFKERSMKFPHRLHAYNEDLYKILMDCDALVLASWSTMLIEAALMGLPTIFYAPKPYGSELFRNYAEAGFCRLVENGAELGEAVSRLCRDEKLYPEPDAEALRYYLGPRDGGASERVARVICGEPVRL